MRFDGQRLRELRTAKKFDQTTLAEHARKQASGITQAAISRYENGAQPSGRNAIALATALGVDVQSLYAADDDEESRALPSYHELLEALRPLGELFQRVSA